MMKKIHLLLVVAIFSVSSYSQELTEIQATVLARLPLHCIPTEYPNKTAHIINNQEEALMTPGTLHPSFMVVSTGTAVCMVTGCL